MTKSQQKKLEALGDKVLDCYENTAGELVLTMTHGTKYFCKTFMGVRGVMSYQPEKVYRNYSKENGLTGFMFEHFN